MEHNSTRTPESPTPETLVQWRQTLRIGEFAMSQCLGVPLRTYMRWERGNNRPPPLLKRTLELLALVASDLPDHWRRFVGSLPHYQPGRPVTSVTMPVWMRPKRKPKRSHRPMGRPRRRDSERPMRRKCLGYRDGFRSWYECGKTVIGGGRICDQCRYDARTVGPFVG